MNDEERIEVLETKSGMPGFLPPRGGKMKPALSYMTEVQCPGCAEINAVWIESDRDTGEFPRLMLHTCDVCDHIFEVSPD